MNAATPITSSTRKWGSAWTQSDLATYNIQVVDCEPEDFFASSTAPSSPNPDIATMPFMAVPWLLHPIDDVLNDQPPPLNARQATDVGDSAYQFLCWLQTTHRSPPAEQRQTSVDHLAESMFALCEYDSYDSVNKIRPVVSFRNQTRFCADGQLATLKSETRACLVDPQTSISLLVTEGKTLAQNIIEEEGAEAEVIAAAIVAFGRNNEIQSSLPEFGSITIPCVTLVNGRPTFYLVPVTTALSNSARYAAHGQTPPVTVVKRCHTYLHGVDDDKELLNITTQPAYRERALQRVLAFKSVAEQHWRTFLS